MTDLDRLKAFLDGAGVHYDVEGRTDYMAKDAEGRQTWPELPGCSIVIASLLPIGPSDERRWCDKVGGYSGFFTRAEFDEAGALVTIGAWE